MLKIKKITHRKITLKTLEEFLSCKKREPFASYRQKSKAINFGLIFGASARTLARTVLDAEWSDKEAQEFVDQNNLHDLKTSIQEKYQKEKLSEREVLLLTCATYIREKFFESYKGLAERIEAMKTYAQEKGFIRSYHGAFRRLPLLAFPEGEEDNYGELANEKNIATNSSIQNFESCLMKQALLEFDEWAKKMGKRAVIFAVIHDAVELYVHRDDLPEVVKALKEAMTRDRPELAGIPIECEGNVADWWGKGQLWDQGDPVK